MPFIQLTDFTLHYEQAGTGHTPIVLVHGNFASWRWWQPFLQDLPKDYCAYAPEMRGFGDSETTNSGYNVEQFAADLAEFTQQLGLNHFHLVGHSLGGAIALQYTLNHPQQVKTLTLVAPAPAQGMPRLKQTTWLGLPRLSHTVEFHQLLNSLNLNRAGLKRALKRMMPFSDPEAAWFKALLDDATRVSPQAIVEMIYSLGDWQVQSRLAEVKQPVLILWGDLDTIVSRLALQRTVDALPKAEWVIWSQVGHVPQLEQPEHFNQLLLTFIEAQTASNVALPKLRTFELIRNQMRQRLGNGWQKLKGLFLKN